MSPCMRTGSLTDYLVAHPVISKAGYLYRLGLVRLMTIFSPLDPRSRVLDEDSDTIAPLTPGLHIGLIAVASFAFLSFFSALSLFVYLSYKLISWHIGVSQRRPLVDAASARRNFTLGIDDLAADGEARKSANVTGYAEPAMAVRKPPNQFLVLVFNLVLADLHQATAFLLSSAWVARDGIVVGTPTCFAQGLFDSNGDLSSSYFISAVAIHTYLSVVRGYRPPQRVLNGCIVGIWVFVYMMSLLPIAVTRNGADMGGYFVRAGPWCWISMAYERLRLLTHYVFIFVSVATITTFYAALFLRRRQQQHHRPAAFLAYPLAYVSCILPLALGRVATMASNGWLDVVLFCTTRRGIVFGGLGTVGAADTGGVDMEVDIDMDGDGRWERGTRTDVESDVVVGAG
ncbi:G protein-coupled glucose receptor regulating Gpa2-domain-containing protein [Xylariaceae sp. FL0016]|nr:G protein-coupled glucose receptor regulating Gpa2-domain-containing protein [Xylariaceae sp. FL0016]